MGIKIVGVMDALSISHCDLMGHSMGGKVAMRLARLSPHPAVSIYPV